MRLVALFSSLFWSLSLFAQLPIVQLPQLKSAAVSIQNLTNISANGFRWWVSSDLAVTTIVSNQWLDRIVSAATAQATTANQPTNAAKGMRFNGSQWLTYGTITVPPTTGANPNYGWVYLIFNSDVQSGSPTIKGIACAPDGSGVDIDNNSKLEYAGTVSGGPNVVGTAVTTTTNLDVLINYTGTNTTWYTNGVAMVTNTTSSTDRVVTSQFFGSSGSPSFEGPWKGYLLEYFASSNEFASFTQIANAHKYATNQYSYAP